MRTLLLLLAVPLLAQNPNASPKSAPSGKTIPILGSTIPTIPTELQIEFLKSYGDRAKAIADQAVATLNAEHADAAFKATRDKLIAKCGDRADLTVNEKGVAGCAAKAEPPKPEAEKPAPKPER